MKGLILFFVITIYHNHYLICIALATVNKRDKAVFVSRK